jgi:hypothetical protein
MERNSSFSRPKQRVTCHTSEPDELSTQSLRSIFQTKILTVRVLNWNICYPSGSQTVRRGALGRREIFLGRREIFKYFH